MPEAAVRSSRPYGLADQFTEMKMFSAAEQMSADGRYRCKSRFAEGVKNSKACWRIFRVMI
jgi:hypothetical protein